MCQHMDVFRRIAFLFIFVSSSCLAVDGINFSAGYGSCDSVRGGRVSLNWDWSWVLMQEWPINLTGYWDASFAYWHTNGEQQSLAVGAIAPVFRLVPSPRYVSNIFPFLEGSVGFAVLSNDELGHRGLGANWAFQDLLAGGIRFGSRGQYELTYHYMHYSNAGLHHPNNGVDITWMLSFRYRLNCR